MKDKGFFVGLSLGIGNSHPDYINIHVNSEVIKKAVKKDLQCINYIKKDLYYAFITLYNYQIKSQKEG